MIPESIPLRTLIDLLILGAVGYSGWICFSRKGRFPDRRPSVGPLITLSGLSLIALLYLFDLAAMHVFPLFLPMGMSLAIMEDTHLDFHWIAVLFGATAIAAGSGIATRDLLSYSGRLRESEKRFRRSFENAGVGAAIVEMDGRFREVNQALCRMLGYSEKELLGKDFDDITHPEDRGKGHDVLRRMLAGEIGTAEIEKRYLHKTGRIVQAIVSTTLIRDPGGSPLHTVAHIQDITDRKRAEEALAESEARFRDFAGSASDWLWEMGPDLRFSYLSDRFFKLSGWDKGDIIGRAWFEMMDPEELEAEPGKWREHRADLEAHRPFRDLEYSARTMGDGLGHVMVSGVPFFDADGVFAGYRGAAKDITGRKRAEEALRDARDEMEARVGERTARLGESEERLRRLFDHVPAAIFFKDPEGRYLLVNRTFEAWCGGSGDDMEGKAAGDFFDPGYADLFTGYDQLALGGGAIVREPRSVPCPDGKVRDFMVIKFPVAGEDGRLSGIGGVVLDLTEHVRIEQALRKSETRLRGILDNVADGVVTIDGKGRIETFNPAAEAMFGYTAGEITGRTVSNLMVEADRGKHLGYLRGYLETGQGRILGAGARELVARRKDGSSFPISLSVGEVRFHDRRVFIGAIQDITSRKQAEEALRKSEASLANAQRIAHIGSFDWNIDTGERYWSDEICRIFGLRPGVDDFAAFMDRIHPDDRPSVEEAAEGMRREGRPYDLVFRVVLPSGEERIVRDYVKVTRIEGGRAMELSGIIQDITERKKTEEALREAKEAAENASKLKTRFFAAASHDLRQPFQAMELLVSALSDRTHDQESTSIIADLTEVLAGTIDLLETMLGVSQLDAGAVLPEKEDFPVNAVLHRLEAAYRRTARKRGLELRVVPSSAIIHTDLHLLERVVGNYLSNAVRYTLPGRRILLGCRRRGANLRIEVRDTGIGIARDKLELIFEEFHQIGNVERDRNQGLGLGLAIVRRLALLLGHPVGVESTLGKGSVFTVEVPLAAAGSDEPRRRHVDGKHGPDFPDIDAAGINAAATFAILIEDDIDVRKALKRTLEGWGCRVIAGGTVRRVLAQFGDRETAPDVIIADYRLPEGLSGIGAITRISNEFNREIPGLVITGDMSPEVVREASARGYHLLYKPVSSEKLRALLGSLTGKGAGAIRTQAGMNR